MGRPPFPPPSEVPDTARHRALAAASRVRMLRLVRDAGSDGMTAAEVAEATALHLSTVRAHLEQLAESGLLTRDRQADGSPGRPAWRYRAVARPDDPADRPYRDLAAALVAHLARNEADPHAAGVRAGQDWGRALAAPLPPLAPAEGLLRVLDQLGFSPEVVHRCGQDPAVVHLRSCPFLALAEANPDVVCGVHLGVIAGALDALGASANDAELEPFAAPGACVVRLHARAPAAARPARAARSTRPARGGKR